jgi:hypothetical protein
MEKLKTLNRIYFGTGISKKGSIATMGLGLDFLSMLLRAKKLAGTTVAEEITHILNGKGYGVDEQQANEIIASEKEVLKPIISNLGIENYNIVEPPKLSQLSLDSANTDAIERIREMISCGFISPAILQDYLTYQTLITRIIEQHSQRLTKLGYAESEAVINPELHLMKNLGEGTLNEHVFDEFYKVCFPNSRSDFDYVQSGRTATGNIRAPYTVVADKYGRQEAPLINQNINNFIREFDGKINPQTIAHYHTTIVDPYEQQFGTVHAKDTIAKVSAIQEEINKGGKML